MPKKYDTERIRESVQIADVIGNYIDLQADGREFKARCPFHDERTPSFHVIPEKRFYHCFGCGAHGDVIDFVQEYTGCSFREACDALGGEQLPDGQPIQRRPAEERHDPYAGYERFDVPDIIEPGQPIDLINPKRDGKVWRGAVPVSAHNYGYGKWVLRLEIDGKKLTPQVCMTNAGWTLYPFPEPRPLYGLASLQAAPADRQVLIVEGEKAADAARALVGDTLVVISWCGGTNGISKTDLTPLRGRKVVIIPDNDPPGFKAAAELVNRCGFGSWKTVIPPVDYPNGWDIADREWASGDELLTWCKAHIGDLPGDLLDEPLPEPLPCDLENGHDDDYIPPLEDATAVEPADTQRWKTFLMYKADGESLQPTVNNAQVLLSYHHEMRNVVGYNLFTKSVDIVRRPPWETEPQQYPRALHDVDDTRATAWLERHGCKLSIGTVHNALVSAAHHRPFNPLQDYLGSLMWDGKPRLTSAMHRYFGCDDTDYTRAVSRRFLIGAVARALRPGCKMDTMLILEGPQGLKKSTAVAELFGENWFTDELGDLGSKDAGMQVQGVWCVEIAELSTLGRAEAARIKEWISRRVDRFRPPYGRNVVEAPRQCVLVGTVNPEGGYLRDATGGRRFWPIRCTDIDVETIRAERDQLWAEACDAYYAGEPWWFDHNERHVAQTEQEERYESDPWADTVLTFIANMNIVTISEIMKHLDLPSSQQTQVAQNRIQKILTGEDWTRKQRRHDGRRQWVYVRDRWGTN